MNTDDLFLALGEVDEAYLLPSLESARKHQKPKTWRRIIAAAACLALIITGGVRGYEAVRNQPPVLVYPTENAPRKLYRGHLTYYKINYYTYAQMAEEADVIVCADVVDNGYTFETGTKRKDHIVLYATLSVREVLKGDVAINKPLHIKDYAIGYYDENGDYDEELIHTVGVLMEKGNRVLLFLKKLPRAFATEDNRTITHNIVYGAEGKFFYDADGLYHSAVLYTDENWFSTNMLTDYTPKTLDEIKKLING